jgi:hypothetical protein
MQLALPVRSSSRLIARTAQGERRVSPAAYRLLLTGHIMVSGAWLGLVVAKLALTVSAVRAGEVDVASALYRAAEAVNILFPAAAIATIVTGVVLSLGTKWGLLRHYWVATKLLLTVGVIATGVQLSDRLFQQAVASPSVSPSGEITVLGVAPTLLIALSMTHLLMLGAATVISVYKPWGRTWFTRPATERQRTN